MKFDIQIQQIFIEQPNFFAKKSIVVSGQISCSPGQAPCHFFPLTRWKWVIDWTHFEDMERIKEVVTTEPEEDPGVQASVSWKAVKVH